MAWYRSGVFFVFIVDVYPQDCFAICLDKSHQPACGRQENQGLRILAKNESFRVRQPTAGRQSGAVSLRYTSTLCLPAGQAGFITLGNHFFMRVYCFLRYSRLLRNFFYANILRPALLGCSALGDLRVGSVCFWSGWRAIAD
jgi:hypothetical protein